MRDCLAGLHCDPSFVSQVFSMKSFPIVKRETNIVVSSDTRSPYIFPPQTSQIKVRVTEGPTMGGIDGRNKDTSVLRCATQLSPQVGRDNGTRAACPSATCDGTEDIKDCKVATTPYTIFGVTSPPKNLSQPEQKTR